jgi:hypothetical protein
MSAAVYRSWQFLVPGIDASDEFSGLMLNPRGGIEMVTDSASVRQAILLLLKTTPGERVMRPDYGCDLQRLIFSPNDPTTAGLALHYVRQALARWEPRIEILRLDAGTNDLEPWRLDIVLEYRLKATRRVEALAIPVDLAGEEG